MDGFGIVAETLLDQPGTSRWQELRQGLGGLVEVIVGIEDLEVDPARWHRSPLGIHDMCVR